MEEIWASIEDFPTYNVSDLGRVVNGDTGKILKQSLTRQGAVKVGLVLGGVQYTRSVKVLVAEAFVQGRSELFDTPIHLDNDQMNNRADNLLWRPRWFAWKYTRQFSEISRPHKRGPIVDLESGEVYKNVIEAAINNGLLFKDVWRSIQVKKPAFPTWQMFDLVRE